MSDPDPWVALDQLKAIESIIRGLLPKEDLEACVTAAQCVGALMGHYLSEKDAASRWKRLYLESLKE